MSTRKITFTGHDGDTLNARLDLPDGPVRAAALFAHCFTCSKDIPAARRIAGRLAAQGIAVLRFDFTGLGHSEGEFENTNFSSNVEDLQRAAAYLAEHVAAPQLLIGHSLGGSAVIKAAPLIDTVRAVVTIAAPADPSHVSKLFAEQLAAIDTHGEAEVNLAGRPFRIRQQFIDDITEAKLDDALKHMNAALLVLHSPQDTLVGIRNAAEIFQGAMHPKSFVTLDNADHLISRGADADYAADVLGAWAVRYLQMADDSSLAATPEGVTRVSEVDPEGFRQAITVSGPHLLTADEPVKMGGTDKGPSPYQLVAAGLGACTSMTIRMYARRKRIALDHVYTDVSHNKEHRTDCEHCGESGAKVDVFQRRIHLGGDLGADDRQRLLEIADKCPVHRTLESTVVIDTELIDD
ncbi:bifunctional alpha/beta hydrolase/OsmC family protein [Spiribacter vilamensis]|uniref:Putative redox protein n=1 Tax=Spiribacter vilamensis TaxID=531306 RepID=A0A4Q8CZF7_9GAMM|nr:bifunctional alpha/beta hydrolase/OsmC family protein [Spiribacter vilamensis]RZU98300.1 putative redox protein [Spiribacter vilamensis]TVO60808.1 OsmC family protein [Spiribacter vilamensis]